MLLSFFRFYDPQLPCHPADQSKQNMQDLFWLSLQHYGASNQTGIWLIGLVCAIHCHIHRTLSSLLGGSPSDELSRLKIEVESISVSV